MKTSYKRTFAQRWSFPRTNRSLVRKEQKSIKINDDKKLKEGNDKVICRPRYMAFLRILHWYVEYCSPKMRIRRINKKETQCCLIAHSCRSLKWSRKSIIITFLVKKKEGRAIKQKIEKGDEKRWKISGQSTRYMFTRY